MWNKAHNLIDILLIDIDQIILRIFSQFINIVINYV